MRAAGSKKPASCILHFSAWFPHPRERVRVRAADSKKLASSIFHFSICTSAHRPTTNRSPQWIVGTLIAKMPKCDGRGERTRSADFSGRCSTHPDASARIYTPIFILRCCTFQAGVLMGDIVSSEKRSEIMSHVRGRGNKATELALMSFFRSHRINGWRRHLALFGTPDFVFRTLRIVVFVDGCFWHACPLHRTIPSTNREFWRKKLSRNRQRDRLVNLTLRRAGWTVIRVWQHDLSNSRSLKRKLAALIQ